MAQRAKSRAMKRLSIPWVVIPIIALIADGSIFAQDSQDQTDWSAPRPVQPPRISSAAAVASEESKSAFAYWCESPTLTCDWWTLRKKLDDKGITFPINYTVDVFGNPVGGASQGVAYTGVLSLSANIDFEKLIGWKGASFGTQWFWIDGQDLSEKHIHNLFTIDNLAAFSTFRMGSLWFQQNVFSDKVSLRAGILALDSEFDNSQVGSLFINTVFGWGPFLANNIPNGGGPNYPMGAPGVRLALNPVDWFTYQGAITQGNVYPQNVNRHGFRWRLNNDIGYLYIQEAIFHLNPNGKYWGNYRFGSWIFNGQTPAPGHPDTTLHNNYGFYFMGDQMILPTSIDDKTQGLAAFGHIAFDPPHRNVIQFYVDGGLTYTGIGSARPHDAVGVAVAFGNLSNGGILDATDGMGSSMTGEFLVEATYSFQVTGWLSIQPDLQYIVQPGGVGGIPNALVVGIRAAVNF